MDWFCTEETRSELMRREKRLTAAFRILAGVTVAAFIVLCLLIRTENARTLHWVLICVTAVLGWICILIRIPGVQEARTRLGHMGMLLEGEKDFREGRVTVTRESIQIPRSIRIRKVLLDAGGEEPERLNLDERWVSRMPPDGSRVRLAVTHTYIAGAEILEEAPRAGGASRRPARAKKIVKLLPLLGIWALTAIFLSSFVFYQITDTDAAHKITLYVDGEVQREDQLAARLEKKMAAPVRMVQVHPFRYAMFGSAALKAADLFIVPDSEKDLYIDWFAPGEEGIPVYDPESGTSFCGSWILYSPEDTYRLYIGAGSPHLEDGLARQAAGLLLSLETEKEENK